MRKSLCLAALVLVSMVAATASAKTPARLAPLNYCPGVYCNNDNDCWTHCIGGVGASYCNRSLHNCVPY